MEPFKHAEGNYPPPDNYNNNHSSIYGGIQFQGSNNQGYDTIDYQHNDSAASIFVARFHLENFPDHALAPGFNIHFPSGIHSYQQPCNQQLQQQPPIMSIYDYSTGYDGARPPYVLAVQPPFCPVPAEGAMEAPSSPSAQPFPIIDDHQSCGEMLRRDGEDDDDEHQGKKRRTNYRKPENAAKLNAAVNALIMQRQGHGDIRAVSKIFDIPYNTLRDNYLRVTIGEVRPSKRISKKPKRSQMVNNGETPLNSLSQSHVEKDDGEPLSDLLVKTS